MPRVHVFARDHINTDEIIPARHLTTFEEKKLAKYAMEDYDKDFVKRVQPGDIIVGDDDGVVVIPPSLLQEVVDDAYEQELQDAWAYEQVKAGYPVDGMFPPNAEWKAKFAEYRKTLPDAPAPEGDA